jgi:hypothetical protein
MPDGLFDAFLVDSASEQQQFLDGLNPRFVNASDMGFVPSDYVADFHRRSSASHGTLTAPGGEVPPGKLHRFRQLT